MATIDETTETISSSSNGHGGALAPLSHHFDTLPIAAWHSGMPARPEILSSKANPAELMHALRRRWALAFVAGIATSLVCVAAVYLLFPVKYEAVASLRITSVAPRVLSGVASTNDTDFHAYKHYQQQLVKTPTVLNSMLRNFPDVAESATLRPHKDDPLAWLENQITVDFPGDGELMRIAMQGENPKELAMIVNAVKDTYFAEIVEKEKQDRLRTAGELEKLHREKLDDMRQLSSDINKRIRLEGNSATRQMIQSLEMDQLKSAIFDYNRLQDRMRDVNMRIALAEAKKKATKEVKVHDFAITQMVDADQQLMIMNDSVQKMQRELTMLEGVVKGSSTSPKIKALKNQINKLEDSMEDRRADLRASAIQRYMAESAHETPDHYSLPLLMTERDALEKLVKEAGDLVEKKQGDIKKINLDSSILDLKQTELSEVSAFAYKIGQEVEYWKVEAKAKERISQIDPATEPKSNDAKKRNITMAAAGVFGFALAVFGVAFVEFQSRRLNSLKQVNEGLGLRVLGQLPPLSARAYRRMSTGHRGLMLQAQLNNAIDSIRATLMHTTGVETPRVVMVTSADPQEGKTTVACQLAVSLARSGRRTALVDLDLRNPTIHRVFGAPQEPGVCELLRSKEYQDVAAHPAQQPNLWLIPTGRCDYESVHALSRSGLGDVIESLKAQFDVVVIDSAPVLTVADPMLIGQHADVAILSTQRDVSKVSGIYEATERLRSVGVTVLGAVVNGIRPTSVARVAATVTADASTESTTTSETA